MTCHPTESACLLLDISQRRTALTASLLTIDKFPDAWIYVHSNNSATKDSSKAGYATVYTIYIEHPNGSSGEVSKACGENISNYDAEVTAIENTLLLVTTQMQLHCISCNDKEYCHLYAMSALLSLDEDPVSKPELKTIIAESHELMGIFDVKIFMQWIPGH